MLITGTLIPSRSHKIDQTYTLILLCCQISKVLVVCQHISSCAFLNEEYLIDGFTSRGYIVLELRLAMGQHWANHSDELSRALLKVRDVLDHLRVDCDGTLFPQLEWQEVKVVQNTRLVSRCPECYGLSHLLVKARANLISTSNLFQSVQPIFQLRRLLIQVTQNVCQRTSH